MSRAPVLQVIVLAAGASTRFGTPKQLATLEGHPLLQHVLSRAIQLAGSSVTVVLGANAAAIAPMLSRSPASVVINRQWQEGLASSIRAGVRSLPGSCDGALLLLADQVGVSTLDLQRLADAWRRQPQCIAAARYGGGLGVPAIFPRSDFAALLTLRGDRGAQALLRRSTDRLVAVEMPNAAQDVDTPEELQSAREGLSSDSTDQ
jgi:CTP:molybdopterin cytidylyltransferase MocA